MSICVRKVHAHITFVYKQPGGRGHPPVVVRKQQRTKHRISSRNKPRNANHTHTHKPAPSTNHRTVKRKCTSWVETDKLASTTKCDVVATKKSRRNHVYMCTWSASSYYYTIITTIILLLFLYYYYNIIIVILLIIIISYIIIITLYYYPIIFVLLILYYYHIIINYYCIILTLLLYYS